MYTSVGNWISITGILWQLLQTNGTELRFEFQLINYSIISLFPQLIILMTIIANIIRHKMECNLQTLVLWKVGDQKYNTCLLLFPNINYAINNSIYD